jgi:hypothetical protein
MMRSLEIFTIVMVLATGLVGAAGMPDLLNYQGVLRDVADNPLDGPYDMIFNFYDADVGGDQILYDKQTGGGAVIVTDGLFNVALGSGAVFDGLGPGTYTSLTEMFAAYGTVYLEIDVAGELLSPRVQVISAAYALNAARLEGRPAGEFIDTSSTAQIKTGPLTVDASAIAFSTGVTGYGTEHGGYFEDLDSSAYAMAGFGDTGLQAAGNGMGGYFLNRIGSGYAYVGYGNRGIEGYGNTMGGYFADSDDSGYAYLGEGDHGVAGFGNTMGGYFIDLDGSGQGYIGIGNTGVEGVGSTRGGHFRDSDSSGYAYLGDGDYGILGYGNLMGGYFEDLDNTSHTHIAVGGYGVRSWGNVGGGYFEDLVSASYAYVGTGSYKIQGSGTVSFIQNHPENPKQVIVYAAPEGDEVATYTRGSARLVDGEARVKLGETFALVTNPDIGLTAHVTPRGRSADLYVQSVTTGEIIVRSDDLSSQSVLFDYLVYGLRIGFEEISIVQEKKQEAYIPSMKDHRDRYQRDPKLRVFNALERFKGMTAAVQGVDAADLDFTRTEALRTAIQEYDPTVHGPVGERPETHHSKKSGHPDSSVSTAEISTPSVESVSTFGDTPGAGSAPVIPVDRPPLSLPVHGSIEPGDVLVADPERIGSLRRSFRAVDPAVVGIATSEGIDGRAQVAVAGIVECRVDAGFGAVRVGDLLTVSPMPGHAMLAIEPLPGTVLGKALEPLETGAGLVRILVMPR